MILNLLRTNLLNILLIGALSLSVVGVYFAWKNSIEERVRINMNLQTTRVALQSAERELEANRRLVAERDAIIRRLEERNRDLEARTQRARQYLNSEQARSRNTQTSPIITRTIELLSVN